MTDRQFADLFAIAQAAPGPNIIVVTLIGYQAAGIAGALVATLAMCGPTCVITYYVSRTFDRFKDAHWRIVVQAGLVPVSVGLFAAGAFVIARAADKSLVAVAHHARDRRGCLLDTVQSALAVRGRRPARIRGFRLMQCEGAPCSAEVQSPDEPPPLGLSGTGCREFGQANSPVDRARFCRF